MNSSSLVVRLLPVIRGSGFFMCVISVFFVLSILIFLFPGIKNICLLLGKQIFRFFYFFMGRK